MAYDLAEEEFNVVTMRLENARTERRRLEDEKRNAEKTLCDLREQMRSVERARTELVHLKRKVNFRRFLLCLHYCAGSGR